MGLFGRFNKKDQNLGNDLFHSLRRYSEYIMKFISMQQQGSYSPIAAYENRKGEITGFVYAMADDGTYTLSVEEVINSMNEKFENELSAGLIKSYVILYHSQFANDGNHNVALANDQLKAITIWHHFENGNEDRVGLQYLVDDGRIRYQGIPEFSAAENKAIFDTPLTDGRDYFTDREEITAPVYENEAGIKVSKSNIQNINNTWCGIYGFESFRKPAGGQNLREHFALALSKPPVYSSERIAVSHLEFSDVIFKSITLNNQPLSLLPIVKTDYTVDFETKEINEWENVDNMEAIVSGSGRNNFGLWFLATDYAENSERYLTRKNLQVKISGIAFVVDVHKETERTDGLNISEDFTCYFPSKQLPNNACFDFIGALEDFRETRLLIDNSLSGYILKLRLITHEEIRDYFTIDIFVSHENMRVKELVKGMKLTGLFQMQGRIAE